MKLLTRVGWAVGVVLLGLCSSPLMAADAALEAIPEGAAVVVRLKAPKTTTDKVAAFVNMVQPGFGQQVKLQAKAIGIGILNPTMEGVDESKDWYVAVFAPEPGEEKPDTVFIIPATDTKRMAEGLGEDVKFMDYSGFGVYTQSEAAAEVMKKHLSSKGKSMASVIDASSLAAMDRGELAVYVNVAGLLTKYSAELEALAEQGLNEIDNLPEQDGVDPEAARAMLKLMLDGGLKGLKDVTGLVATVSVVKTGVTLEQFAKVKSGSGVDKILAKSAPEDLAGIGQLPEGEHIYLGARFDTATAIDLSKQIFKVMPLENDVREKFEKSLAETKSMKFGAVIGAMSLGDLESGLIQGVTQMFVSPTDKMREMFKAQAELSAATSKVPGLTMKTEYKEGADKVGDVSVDEMTLTVELDDDAEEQAQMSKKILDYVYGSEGMTARYAFLKDRVVYTIGGDLDDMKAALDNVSSPAKPTEGFLKTRGKLSEKANIVYMMDLAQLIADGAQLASEAGLVPFQINDDLIEGLDLKESYIGFSAATEPQAVRVVWHVPVEQVQGFAKMAIMGAALQAGQ